ncbi:MAG: SGNH/GDSL hydrolase family protein [Paenibacillaceae bacterium]|nr:SGNH/GDSL hydrolase family protein [Paenibacillaceae bacterium]
MIYTAVGDSITFGESASSRKRAYPGLALAALRVEERKTSGIVLARPGWSSTDLLHALHGRESSAVRQADVVTVWIGGVDLIRAALLPLQTGQPAAAGPAMARFKRRLRAILVRIRRISRARIVCCTQYNPFPHTPLAGEWIRLMNRAIQEVASACGARVAPVHKWFAGKEAALIAGYRHGTVADAYRGSLPIHPNDRGHRAIAKGLAPYLLPRS